MPRTILTHFLPALTSQEQLAGDVVVVIDVLRASTVICQALAAGAKEVIPCLEVPDARELARRYGEAGVLGGEREGVRIAGFQLGNSPREYTAESVGGKTLLFTTTNGTRAMQLCLGASRVVIGAFVNLTTVLKALQGEETVHLLCAGTRGEVTREDVLFAGALVHGWRARESSPPRWNDQSELAATAWSEVAKKGLAADSLAAELRNTQGGRNLQKLGLAADIADVARVDFLPVLPELDRTLWRIFNTAVA